MKSHRSVSPVKPPLRIPVSTLTTEHLSALEAFERWQREALRSGPVHSTERPLRDAAEQPVNN
jgi:hypothetical protein